MAEADPKELRKDSTKPGPIVLKMTLKKWGVSKRERDVGERLL
jgi:hypothetical protein